MQHTLQLNLANMHNPHLYLYSWRVSPSWGPDKSRRHSQPFFWDPEHLGQGEGRWFSQELQGTGKTSLSHPRHQSLSQNSLPTSLRWTSFCDSFWSGSLPLIDYEILKGRNMSYALVRHQRLAQDVPPIGVHKCLLNERQERGGQKRSLEDLPGNCFPCVCLGAQNI